MGAAESKLEKKVAVKKSEKVMQEEEIMHPLRKELEELKEEVKKLKKEVEEVNAERAHLRREIDERNKKY